MSARLRLLSSARRAPARPAPHPRSRGLWDLDWGAFLPFSLGHGVSAELGTFEEALPFIGDHYGEIFGSPGSTAFLHEPMTEARRRFGGEMDVFLFRSSSKTIGIFFADPIDWSTYYLRSGAFLRAHRRRGLMQSFFGKLWAPLRAAGVARAHCEVSVVNRPILGLLAKEGFVATSHGSSERWGAVEGLTKFLSVEAEQVFRRQFCRMPVSTTGLDPEERSRS